MKKLIFICSSLLLLMACGGLTKISTESFTYDEGVIFQAQAIKKVKLKEKIGKQPDEIYIAPKGSKFIMLNLVFENLTENKQSVDLEEIFILDDQDNKYSVDYYMKGLTTSPNTIGEIEFKANKKQKITLSFHPAFPSNSTIRILANGTVYKLQ